jgi:hypothetical protein
MGRRHQAPLTLRFHKIAEPQDPAWDRWMEHGELTGMITELPGSPPWSGDEIKARADEYEKIHVRLNARYTEYRDYRLALRAKELSKQEGTDLTDLPNLGKKQFRQPKIAEMLTEEFEFTVSRQRVGRAIMDVKAWSKWISGNSHSITDPTKKPPPRSD